MQYGIVSHSLKPYHSVLGGDFSFPQQEKKEYQQHCGFVGFFIELIFLSAHA